MCVDVGNGIPSAMLCLNISIDLRNRAIFSSASAIANSQDGLTVDLAFVVDGLCTFMAVAFRADLAQARMAEEAR